MGRDNRIHEPRLLTASGGKIGCLLVTRSDPPVNFRFRGEADTGLMHLYGRF